MENTRKIVKKIVPTKLFRKIEPTGHLVEAVLSNVKNGFPARGMHVIGVTGTNGKTTTTSMIYQMLSAAGYKTAMMSTVSHGTFGEVISQHAHVTTAPSRVLQRYIKDFKKAGVEWLVLETSSHALIQHRAWGVPYEIAVMTNVTGDHLDYHGTFENYLNAKRKLFKLAAKNGMKFGVINAEDKTADKFINTIPNSVTYGLKKGDVTAHDIEMFVDHSTFKAKADKDVYDITVNLPGDFNISNALAAIAVGRKIGLSVAQIEKGIAALKNVEGRMALVDAGQDFRVMVDHASTPDAFEKFFSNVRPITKGKLVAVFGSAGRRDENKRAVQGEIAGRYCDEVILTEEDDRDCDGNEILNQIADGAKKAGKVKDRDMFLILDRTEAINFAVTRVVSKDDTVVLLGKGHEKTIERADGDIEWDEPEIAKMAIKKLKK